MVLDESVSLSANTLVGDRRDPGIQESFRKIRQGSQMQIGSRTPRRLSSSQSAKTAPQLRSHLEQVLNVPQRVRLRPVLRLRPCWMTFFSSLPGNF